MSICFIKGLVLILPVSKKEELLKLANDANPRVRAVAIQELGEITDGSLAPVLLDALGDPAWQVRVEAVRSLAKHNTPVVIPALQPCLEDESVEVRQVTRDAIRMLRHKQRAGHLLPEIERSIPRVLQDVKFPKWLGKVELVFALVASTFMLISTIRFLTVILWSDRTTGDIMWSILLVFVMVGTFLLVFVVAGILQSHLRFREMFNHIKQKPWQRFVEIIFII
ncbi:MAG: PBS lyase, partial [Promethearchaeota archaeon CR_4]